MIDTIPLPQVRRYLESEFGGLDWTILPLATRELQIDVKTGPTGIKSITLDDFDRLRLHLSDQQVRAKLYTHAERNSSINP